MSSILIDSTFDNSRYESEGSVAEYDSRPIKEDQNGARIRCGKFLRLLERSGGGTMVVGASRSKYWKFRLCQSDMSLNTLR